MSKMVEALELVAGVSQPKTRPRIVIIGGGFAGVAAARAMRKSDADIVLVDRRNHHIFQPLLKPPAWTSRRGPLISTVGPSEREHYPTIIW